MRKISAFTLIELAVVLIIIGILVTGVMQGGNLLNSARLSNARSLTANSPIQKMDGLIAWYETSTLSSFKPAEAINNANISEWYDISPSSLPKGRNKLTRTASTAIMYISSGINKLPSVQFDGSGKISLTDFYQGATAQNTVIAVVRPLSNGVLIDSGNTSANVTAIVLDIPTLTLNLTTPVAVNPTLSIGSDYTIVSNFNASNSAFFVNNATSGYAVNAGTNQLRGLTIGSDRNNCCYYKGLVSEVIVFNRVLKLQERKDVMKYLGQKYHIEVLGL